jgi:bla regulator protein blaR1
MLSYLIFSSAGIGISYILYYLFLKREKTFVFNRFFLLSGIVLSLIAPTLKIDNPIVSPVVTELSGKRFIHETIPQEENISRPSLKKIDNQGYPVKNLLLFIYLAITIIMFLRFTRNLLKLKRLFIHRGPTVNGLQIIYLEKKTAPFSFFSYMFVNQEDFKKNKVTSSQLNHELAHSQQLHSLDILLIELIACCFWFNPFVWLYRKAMAENHEFIADQFAAGQGIDIKTYAKSVIHAVGRYNQQNLTSGFSFIRTKNRITMLNQARSPISTRALKLFIVLSLLSVSLIFSSCISDIPLKPFTVIIDAGHGGHDDGVKFETLNEKNIVLTIARKINDLGAGNNINIVLSRDTDDFIDLISRTEFAANQNADLLLSLHLNYANDSNTHGVEVYYSNKSKFQEQSFYYSEILISEQLKSNFSKGEIKSAPFWVLKKSKVPSVLIELGFLSNELDRTNLQDPKYLDELAGSIYTGLVKIKDQGTY